MHDFQKVNEELAELKEKIRQAEIELDFVKSTERSLKLKLQPRWVILFVFAVFFVECMRAATNKKFEISLLTGIGVGVIVVGYLIYVIIMAVKNREHNKEQAFNYDLKKAAYEKLQERKREIFANHAKETGGVKLEYAEENRPVYLWLEDDELTLACILDEIKAETVKKEDINYISSDEKLAEYTKALGEAETVTSGVPYCYLFTKNKTYVFNVDGYDSLKELLPEFELQNKLSKEPK